MPFDNANYLWQSLFMVSGQDNETLFLNAKFGDIQD